jgi:predicted dehydrogenase
MARTLRIGLIGSGFTGRAHSNAWRQAPHYFPLKARLELHTLCARNRVHVETARSQLGWQYSSTDWREVVESPLIDVVDICTLNDSHVEIAIAAARAGKHVLCEKPLALTAADSEKMLAAARKSRVKHMVMFNYRRVPAVAFARQMIESGQLGAVRHFRATYLQDWLCDPKFPMSWRTRKESAGSGAHGDLNSHLVDMARYLVGEITETVGLQETFIKERPRDAQAATLAAPSARNIEKVTVDDAAIFLARFGTGKNVAPGAYASIESTRIAPGRKNFNRWEINASEGSIAFNLERLNELDYCDRRDAADKPGFKTILCTQSTHPYMNAWWRPGHAIGYEHTFIHAISDFVNAVASGSDMQPDFLDGARCAAVIEAAVSSGKTGKWVKVRAVK